MVLTDVLPLLAGTARHGATVVLEAYASLYPAGRSTRPERRRRQGAWTGTIERSARTARRHQLRR